MRTKIKVNKFAKIESADVYLDEFLLFVGDNNSGKTLLMELIYGIVELIRKWKADYSNVKIVETEYVKYIRFAKEEHELFKIMFNRKINEGAFDFIDLTGSAKTILETISKQTGMSNEDAKQFHLRMWLYVNGIASLAANQTVEFNDEEIIDLLKDQYVSMLLYEVKKGNVKEEILVQLAKKNKEGKE